MSATDVDPRALRDALDPRALRDALDPRALRDAFGAFATGVTVVTTRDGEGRPIGFTANSFASVSLDPPLLLVCLARTSRNFAAMTGAGPGGTDGFAVNVLSEDQQDVSNTFARPVEDRFAGVDWRDGPAGSPIFPAAAAWFDCRRESVVEAGDHVVLIGRVEGFSNSGRNGLGYARGSYFSPALAARAMTAATGGETVVAAVVERAGAILLLERADGSFALPSVTVAARDPAQALETHLLATAGVEAKAGFLFSVYEDRSSARQHIVYRAAALRGEPIGGRFVALADLPMDRLDSTQTADILKRFAAESRLGDYGVYVGNERVGRVHALGGKVS